ncbi:MAG: hypothetical protein ACFCUU_02340 [Cyclobacteriaceae bacterium]
MARIFIIGMVILMAIANAACTRYQYFNLESSLTKLELGTYTFDSDSVNIAYNFVGYGGRMQIKITNKLNKPLYVDWSRSAKIKDGRQFPYWQDAFHNEVVIAREKIMQIAPGAYEVVAPLNVSIGYLKPAESKRQKYTVKTTGGNAVNANLYQFDYNETPLKFTNYITLSSDKNFNHDFSLSHEFWLSEIHDTMSAPGNLVEYGQNQFHETKVTDGAYVLLTASLVGLIIAAASAEPEEY